MPIFGLVLFLLTMISSIQHLDSLYITWNEYGHKWVVVNEVHCLVLLLVVTMCVSLDWWGEGYSPCYDVITMQGYLKFTLMINQFIQKQDCAISF